MKRRTIRKAWNSQGSEALAPSRRAIMDSFDRDPFESGSSVRILPPPLDTAKELPIDSVLHVMAQYLLEGRAQVAEYSASASASIRELLAGARSRRFEAVQQAKARRIMLESYRSALKQHSEAQRILGPHVRFNGATAKSLWIFFFLIGDAAAMTLALTYGGESPIFAALMAVAVGAAVIVIGKTAEDIRRESLMKTIKSTDDPETNRVVDAVFGMNESGRILNRRVLMVFVASSLFPAIAVLVYRTAEENFAVGAAFGLWTLLIGSGSFAASWFYCDPARIFISLTQDAVEEAEDIWQSTGIDAIEEHNASVEAARHIVEEHRQRAEAAWSLTISGAAAAMVANSETIGIAQSGGHVLLQQTMPPVRWPDLTSYFEIVDRDDVHPDGEEGMFSMLFGDETNRTVRPPLSEVDRGLDI